MQYESIIKKDLVVNAIFAEFLPGRKIWRHNQKWWLFKRMQRAYFGFYETKFVIKIQRRYRTQYGKGQSSYNVTWHCLKQFQETDSFLHRKVAGSPSTSQEDVDKIQEEFHRTPHKSARRASLQLRISKTTVSRVVHNHLHLYAYKVETVQAQSRTINPDSYLESSCTS
jgi:hypothetical protein